MNFFSRSRSALQPWQWLLVSALFWTAVAITFVLPGLNEQTDWRAALSASLADWWSWAVLTPLIIALDQRLMHSNARLHMPGMVLAAPLAAMAFVYLRALFSAALHIAPWSHLVDARLLPNSMRGIMWSVLVYFLIVGVWSAYRNHQRYVRAELGIERLERSFSDAKLNALRMQLDPHFLFNALNTISAQVGADPKLARKMIEHLGDLLRVSLDPKSRNEISLEQEMAFLAHYLAIQQIRFGDNLKVDIAIADETNRAAVPSLIMQPLVENAIKHGLASRARRGTIQISVWREAATLHIRVADDGVGLPPGWDLAHSTGLGLSITRERIAGLNPNGTSDFSIAPNASGGVDVHLAFPFHLIGD
jgi:signal transduction histidine kinase